ncbi:MAG: helix-turn-helix domain-containing protein [Acidimicrobiales bacterium]|nr:helix-turn-helix domain-containing protein [Acidimicrobiales bacterium]
MTQQSEQHRTTQQAQAEAISPRLVDIAAAAAMLGVEVRHVRRLVQERRIPFVKWGHLLRFDQQEIEAFIDANRVPAASPHR